MIPGLRVDPDVDALPWRPTAVPGVSWLPLHLDPAARSEGRRRPPATVLIRMEPGAGYEAHRHLGTEDVLVLQGGYRDERGEHRTGEHVHYEAGSRHAPVAIGEARRADREGDAACILFACAPGGIELLERGDDRGGPAGSIYSSAP